MQSAGRRACRKKPRGVLRGIIKKKKLKARLTESSSHAILLLSHFLLAFPRLPFLPHTRSHPAETGIKALPPFTFSRFAAFFSAPFFPTIFFSLFRSCFRGRLRPSTAPHALPLTHTCTPRLILLNTRPSPTALSPTSSRKLTNRLPCVSTPHYHWPPRRRVSFRCSP